MQTYALHMQGLPVYGVPMYGMHAECIRHVLRFGLGGADPLAESAWASPNVYVVDVGSRSSAA